MPKDQVVTNLLGKLVRLPINQQGAPWWKTGSDVLCEIVAVWLEEGHLRAQVRAIHTGISFPVYISNVFITIAKANRLVRCSHGLGNERLGT